MKERTRHIENGRLLYRVLARLHNSKNFLILSKKSKRTPKLKKRNLTHKIVTAILKNHPNDNVRGEKVEPCP